MSLASAALASAVARRGICVRGAVQGVGFRPFVWRLAHELALSGWVRNDPHGVAIEVQGRGDRLERFVARLAREAPALARIDAIEMRDLRAGAGPGFDIVASGTGRASTAIGADATVCGQCLAE